MQKIEDWIKNNLPWLAAVTGAVAAFFVGRKSVPGVGPGIAELRADNEQLRQLVEQLRSQLKQLGELNRIGTEQQQQLSDQLRNARQSLELERANLEQNRLEIDKLRESHQRLRDIINSHREELEAIQIDS